MKNILVVFCIAVVTACNTNHLNTDTSSKKTTTDTSGSQLSTPSTTVSDQSARLSQSVDMKIFDKGFAKVNGQNMIRFEINVSNKSDQVITAIKGRFVVDNIFGDHLKNYNLKYDDANIRPGKSIKIIRYWPYDNKAKEDDKIRATPLSKLTITYEPETVYFADGSSLH